MKNPYVRSWWVPSSEGGQWKVSERQDGTFACACPKWKFHPAPKPDCHHIELVKNSSNPSLDFRAAVARACGTAADLAERAL
jgi:hypothetical protein